MSITQFKEAIRGGVRPNLFKVRLHYPTGVPGFNLPGRQAEFLAKGAQLPGSTTGLIDVPFRGRQYKIPGDRTFTEWTLTILNDSGFLHRNGLENWMNIINSHETNVGSTNPLEYLGTAHVDQLDRDGAIIKSYEFFDIFPSEVAPVDLAFDTNDAVEEFTVTFQIQYWKSPESVTN